MVTFYTTFSEKARAFSDEPLFFASEPIPEAIKH